MNSSKFSQLIDILKESPLFSSLSAGDRDEIARHMDEYPLFGEKGSESAQVGYEASWMFMNKLYKDLRAGH